MIILGLDIAAAASGACWDGPNGLPAFATLRQTLDGDNYGPLGTKFRQWLCDLIAVSNCREIALEAPWVPSGSRKPSHPTPVRIPRMLLGLAFLAEQIADECSIACTDADVSTVRKFFVQNGRPPDPKRAVMQRCKQLGWAPRDEHQADAAAIWAYTKALADPRSTFSRVGA